MNQKIATWVGTVIILIIAITAGVFVWVVQKNNPIETGTPVVSVKPVKKPEVATQPAVPADQTAGWQTYKNDKFGFEVKYPADWYTKTGTGDVITKIENKQKDVYLGLDVPDEGLDKYDFGYSVSIIAKLYSTLEKFLETQKTSLGSTAVKLEPVQFGVNKFYKRIADLPGTAGFGTYYIYNNGIGYELGIYDSIANKDLSQDRALSIFEQMLATFKFTN